MPGIEVDASLGADQPRVFLVELGRRDPAMDDVHEHAARGTRRRPSSSRERRGRAGGRGTGRCGPAPRPARAEPRSAQFITSQLWTACSTIQSPERRRWPNQPSSGPHEFDQRIRPSTSVADLAAVDLRGSVSMNRGSARRWWPIWTICLLALAAATTASRSARSGTSASRRRGPCRRR